MMERADMKSSKILYVDVFLHKMMEPADMKSYKMLFVDVFLDKTYKQDGNC